MDIICMFFPAIIFAFLRTKLFGEKYESVFDRVINFAFQYVWGNALINSIIIMARILLKQKAGNILTTLNNYNYFAVKYLILAMILAVFIPHIEKYCKENVAISYTYDVKVKPWSVNVKTVVVTVYAVLMASLHFIRCFDNSFWGDEGIVVVATRMNWASMLAYVASNGHSPFHYAFAWLCIHIFEESGFVYHFSATLPYFIIVAVIATLVRKWFGNKVAVITITLSTLLGCAVIYNLEVRMYAWCQLFIFLAFLMTYKIYKKSGNQYYFLLSLFSLGAVYSHYFALASIGVIYLVLLLCKINDSKKDIWKVIISGGAVLVLLAPWLLYAKKIKGVVMSNYGIGQVTWHDCFEFIFHSSNSIPLLVCFFVTSIVAYINDSEIIKIYKDDTNRKHFNIKLIIKDLGFSNDWIWMISGTCAVFGTIIVAKLISSLVYPIICLRYLYPSFIIIWLLFGINISKMKLNKLWTFVLIAFLFYTCFSPYSLALTRDRANNKRLETTLEATSSEIDEDAFIYTDIVHFAWTVATVYYPNTPHDLFGHAEWWGPLKITNLNPNTDYWLFLGTPISEEVTEDLNSQNYQAELVVDQGFIGTGDVWVYRVIKSVGVN